MYKDYKFNTDTFLVRQELLLQLGVAEMQKEILLENDQFDFETILSLIDKKQSALKDAYKHYLAGDSLLYKVYLNLTMIIEDELKSQLDN